jgi:hypothetical protein
VPRDKGDKIFYFYDFAKKNPAHFGRNGGALKHISKTAQSAYRLLAV